MAPIDRIAVQLFTPKRLFSRDQVLQRPSPVPAVSGIYAWFFRNVPRGVPADGCTTADGTTLLYAFSVRAEWIQWTMTLVYGLAFVEQAVLVFFIERGMRARRAGAVPAEETPS